MTKIRNIQRIDNEITRTHAWFVQVQRNHCIYAKMFSDGVFGSEHKALKAAKKYLMQILTETSNYKYYLHRRTIVRSNNKSGTSGVGRYDMVANPNTGSRVVFWLAYWDDEYGVRRQRKFSVLKYGEEKAEKLATAERKRRLKEVCVAECA